MKFRVIVVGLSLLAGSTLSSITANKTLADWNRFRGPNGTGIAADSSTTPIEWSETKNIKWKAALPGSGASSPIMVGGKLFVTCYTGYGVSREEVGSMDKLTRHLICLDAKSGEKLWQKDVPSEVTEDQYGGMGIPAHGFASHTPTSDGEHVFVFFGKTGVIAFDMDGNQQWKTSVGTESDPKRWGSASSPIVHEGVLVVAAGAESRAVVGLDKTTGQELWRAEAEGLGNVWGTPAVATSGDSTDIVIGAPYEIWGINPETGKLRWYCEAMETDSFNSSVVVNEGNIYAIEGRGGGSIAIKAGGKDDITKSAVIWSGRDNGRFGSPVVYQGRMYNINGGIAYCIDTLTGKEIYKERLRSDTKAGQAQQGTAGERGGRGGRGGGMGGDYSSPVIADGKLYYVTRGGDMYVLAVGDEFKQLAVNRVTAESEDFSATPAISDGSIYLRSNRFVYCVAE